MNRNKRRTVRTQEFNLALNPAILVSERLDQSLPCATSLALVATIVSKQLVLKSTDPVSFFNSSWSCLMASVVVIGFSNLFRSLYFSLTFV